VFDVNVMSGVYLNLKNVTFVSAVDSLQLERYKWNKNFVLISFIVPKKSFELWQVELESLLYCISLNNNPDAGYSIFQ